MSPRQPTDPTLAGAHPPSSSATALSCESYVSRLPSRKRYYAELDKKKALEKVGVAATLHPPPATLEEGSRTKAVPQTTMPPPAVHQVPPTPSSIGSPLSRDSGTIRQICPLPQKETDLITLSDVAKTLSKLRIPQLEGNLKYSRRLGRSVLRASLRLPMPLDSSK